MHLAQDFGAEEIAIGAGFQELRKCDWWPGGCVGEIFAEHRADLFFLAGDGCGGRDCRSQGRRKTTIGQALRSQTIEAEEVRQ